MAYFGPNVKHFLQYKYRKMGLIMQRSEYIDNFLEQIDCNSLIEKIKLEQGDKRSILGVKENVTWVSPDYNDAKRQMYETWEKAGYAKDGGSVEWINLYGGIHFDYDIVLKFSELVDATSHSCWVSQMPVGKCAPWHWDVNKDYDLIKDNPKMVRYSFFIDKPEPGKVFVINDEAHHMREQGSVYKWKKWDDWHLGFNCGLSEKFLFHFIGYSNT